MTILLPLAYLKFNKSISKAENKFLIAGVLSFLLNSISISTFTYVHESRLLILPLLLIFPFLGKISHNLFSDFKWNHQYLLSILGLFAYAAFEPRECLTPILFKAYLAIYTLFFFIIALTLCRKYLKAVTRNLGANHRLFDLLSLYINHAMPCHAVTLSPAVLYQKMIHALNNAIHCSREEF